MYVFWQNKTNISIQSILPREGWGVEHWSTPAPCSHQERGSQPTDQRVANERSTTGLRRRQAGCDLGRSQRRRRVFASRGVRGQVRGPTAAKVSSEGALAQARPRGVSNEATTTRDEGRKGYKKSQTARPEGCCQRQPQTHAYARMASRQACDSCQIHRTLQRHHRSKAGRSKRW